MARCSSFWEAVLGSSDENRRTILQELKSEQKRTPSWEVSDEEMKREGLA